MADMNTWALGAKPTWEGIELFLIPPEFDYECSSRLSLRRVALDRKKAKNKLGFEEALDSALAAGQRVVEALNEPLGNWA